MCCTCRAYARLSAGSQGGLTRITARSNDGTQQVFIVPTTLLSRQVNPSDCEAGTVTLTPEDLLLGATGRRLNPNMPPSYDQAVTGQDRSVKVEDSSKDLSPSTPPEDDDYPPPPEYSPHDNSDSAPLLPAN